MDGQGSGSRAPLPHRGPGPDLSRPGHRSGTRAGHACYPPIALDDLRSLEATWRRLSPAERQAIEEHWDILEWLGHANDFAGSTASAGAKVARARIRQLKPPPLELRAEFEMILERTRRTVVRVRNGTLLLLRQDGIRITRRATIRLSANPVAVGSYTSSLQRLARIARLARWGGHASVGISVALGGKDVYDDWDTSQRYRTISRTTGSLVAGGLGAIAVSYGICNLFLGLPSGGTSIFWCGIVAGGAGAIGGSKVGGRIGEYLYDVSSDVNLVVPRLRR